MRVFLDVDIGNRAAFERELAEYTHTDSFFHRARTQVISAHHHACPRRDDLVQTSDCGRDARSMV